MVGNHELFSQGEPIDKVKITFTCMNCGHRCCGHNEMETVVIEPHTIAYVRETFGMNYLHSLIDTKALDLVIGQGSKIPVVKVGQNLGYCPFLELRVTKEVLMKLGVSKPKSEIEQFIKLAVITAKGRQLAENKNTKMDDFHIPVYEFVNRIFEVIAFANRESKYSTPFADPKVTKLISGLPKVFDALLDGPDYHTSCLVYPARPGACRAFPVGRGMRPKNVDLASVQVLNEIPPEFKDKMPKILETQNENPDDYEEVVRITTHMCPKAAWKGREITIKEYFALQDLNIFTQDYWMAPMAGYLYGKLPLLATFSPMIQNQFFDAIFRACYIQPPYSPDTKVFYRNLKQSLEKTVIPIELEKFFK